MSRNKRYRVILLLLLLGLMFSFQASSQDNSLYFLSNKYDNYIDYLLNSGKMDITHPLNQPYTTEQLYHVIENGESNNNSYWNGILLRELKQYLPSNTKHGRFLAGAEGKVNLDYFENKSDDNYSANIFGTYNYKNITAFYGYDVNTEYLNDTMYFGSTGKLQNRVSGRTSDSYIKYSNEHINVFYGRINRNFGLINTTSLIRSNNPYSYDHFSLEFFNEILKYSYSITRLEDKYAYDIRKDTIPDYNWYKRYITFHRLEIAFSKKFKLALTESILFGGKNQAFIPAYINPVNIFYLSKMSDRKGLEESEANSLFTIELLVKPANKLSLFTQFLIDDIDFTKELRAQYPDRLGFYSKLVYSDPFPQSQLYLSYTRISNWTYNSYYTFGNYTFYGKSLGYPKNGFENITLGFDCFRYPKIFFTILAQYQQERMQDLESPFIAEKTGFPVGISEKAYGVSAEVNYIPNIHLNTRLRVEYLGVNNYQHITNNQKSFLNVHFDFVMKSVFNVFGRM